MDIKIIYFDVRHAVDVHDWIIDNSGGRHGCHDAGQIDSILANIQNDDYYPEIVDKITHLVHSVNKFHAFVDGNKRTSIALGAYLLEINGFDYCVTRFVQELENISVWVAENRVSKELLREIIYSIMMEDEFSEELKLAIISAVTGEV